MKSKEKMPRKMKKRFKKLIKFYDERKQEYEKEKQNVGSLLEFLLIGKIIDLGIAPDSVSDIKVVRREKDIQATVKLHGAFESAEITVNVED